MRRTFRRRWLSIIITSIILSCSLLTLPAHMESKYVSYDDYVMSHQQQFKQGREVREKGADNSAANNSSKENISLEDGAVRYSVLALDCSGSMYGTPMSYARQASIKFCQQVFDEGGSNNYVAVVRFTSTAYLVCDFTNDLSKLTTTINNLYADGGTSQYSALSVSDSALSSISDRNAILNLVLMSDGLPEHGTYSYTGHYSSQDYWGYEYANAAYELASKLKSKYKIYTLGFFHNLYGSNLEFGRRFMQDLSNAGYYEVQNPADLEFEFGQIAEQITSQSGTFKFPGTFNENYDAKASYSYTDAFFKRPATEFRWDLADMSLCLELSTWSSYEESEWSKRTKNARALLTGTNGIGFSDFEQNDYWSIAPSINSIGVVAAKKEIEGQTLIAMLVRGGGYQREWGGNFELGLSGEHRGFSRGRDEALKFLSEYIRKYNITGSIKLWLVGYSRGGAVANMTAGAINTGYNLGNGVTISREDLYCYTFEAPQGTTLSKALAERKSHTGSSNIHNIVNVNDLVPLVAMSYWDFARYGTDHNLFNISSGDYQSALSVMEAQYKKIIDNSGVSIEIKTKDTENRVPDYAQSVDIQVHPTKILPGGSPFIEIKIVDDKSLSNAKLLKDFVNDLAAVGFVLRVNYVEGAEDTIVALLADLLGGRDFSEISKFLVDLRKNLLDDNLAGTRYIIAPLFEISFKSYDERVALVGARLTEQFCSALESSGIAKRISGYAKLIPGINSALGAIARTVAVQNIRFVQFLYNLCGEYNFFQAHYPEMTLAWVRTMAIRSGQQLKLIEMPQTVRIIRINCPVNVDVINVDNGKTVAWIHSDNSTTSDAAVFCAINENGEKVIQVPGDRHYMVNIHATDTGVMNYQVSEYHLTSGETTLVQNYNNVSIALDEAYVGDVPSIAENEYGDAGLEGTTTRYTLTGPKGEIEISSKSKGDEVKYHNVSVKCNNLCGIAYGGGSFLEGSFAKLCAAPVVGGRFEGWFVDGVKVSSDTEYRFSVLHDVSVTAKFMEVPLFSVKFAAAGSGKVENTDVQCASGTQILLSAVPDSGSHFVRWETTVGDSIISDAINTSAVLTMPANNVQVTAVFSGEPISIAQQPEDQYVVVGKRASFMVVASGDDLKYQWYINRNGGKGWIAIDGAIGDEYITSVVDLSNDGYQYKCVIQDASGNVTESGVAVLHVQSPTDIPDTGDMSNPVLWLCMIILGVLILTHERRRKFTK